MPCHTLQLRQLYATYLPEQMTCQILKDFQYVFLIGKRHFTVYLRKFWLSVSTQVLVTETLGNLEIAVETRHHQQLLQCLRALRQRIELPWIHTRRHHKVACTFWSRTNQNRCFYLNKILVVEEVTNQDGHTVAQLQVLTNAGTTQVQITILHTDIVTAISIILYRERRSQTLTQHIQFLSDNLNIARRDILILTLTLVNRTLYLNAPLTSQLVGTFTKRSILRLVENQLCNTIAVTQVNKRHTTHFTGFLYPSGQRHNLPGICES